MRKKALFLARFPLKYFFPFLMGLLGLMGGGALPAMALQSDNPTSIQTKDDLSDLLVMAALPKGVLLKAIEGTFQTSDSFQSLAPSAKSRLLAQIITQFEQDWPLIEQGLIAQLKRTYTIEELQILWAFESLRRELRLSQPPNSVEGARSYQTLQADYQKALENPLIKDYATYGLDYYAVQNQIEALFHKAYGALKQDANP